MEAVSSAMDKKTMIHVAAELVIVGGVTFWLNSKINGQTDALVQLKKENADLRARLERIEQFLSQATGAPPPGPPPSGGRRPRRQSRRTAPGPGTQSEEEEEEVMSSSDEEIEI